MALVLARAVSELSDPALGRAVRAAGVHQPVDHQQRDHGVGVAVHRLPHTQCTVQFLITSVLTVKNTHNMLCGEGVNCI